MYLCSPKDFVRTVPSLRLVSRFALFAALWVGLALAAMPARSLPSSWSCADAVAVEVGEPIDWVAGLGQTSTLLSIHVGSPGRLAVEAQDMEGGARSVWLEVLETDCGSVAEVTASRARSYLNRGLFDVDEAGTVLVRIGRTTQDADASALRLSTHLLESTSRIARSKDGDPGDDTGEEDVEIVPLSSPGDGCGTSKGSATNRLAEFDKDGDPGDDTGEEDVEIVPLVSGPAGCQSACADGEPANDLLVCARPVTFGASVMERLDALHGFDRDHYTFRLGQVASVRIDAHSDPELRALLLDVNGRPLASTELATSATLEATLAAGRYYLRVEGEGDGEYRLELNSSAY